MSIVPIQNTSYFYLAENPLTPLEEMAAEALTAISRSRKMPDEPRGDHSFKVRKKLGAFEVFTDPNKVVVGKKALFRVFDEMMHDAEKRTSPIPEDVQLYFENKKAKKYQKDCPSMRVTKVVKAHFYELIDRANMGCRSDPGFFKRVSYLRNSSQNLNNNIY